MKYIRTKEGNIYKIIKDLYFGRLLLNNKEIVSLNDNDVKIADTIEELCDEFVLFYDSVETKPDLTYRGSFNDLYFQNELKHSAKCYGAIWTNKGLIYVAKMNDKGELELL